MMKKMFEAPSEKLKTLTITLDYARQQVDQSAGVIANAQ